MSKEKTRAELHAEVADLKAKVENRDKVIAETRAKYVESDKSFNEQLRLYAALKEEHEACEKSLNHANSVIAQRNAKVSMLEKERDTAKARVEYLEGELKEKTELNEKQGDRIQKYSESIDLIRADRDKYMYLANNMLEHGVFNFLIVKYRNLKNIAGNGDGCHKGEGRTE